MVAFKSRESVSQTIALYFNYALVFAFITFSFIFIKKVNIWFYCFILALMENLRFF